MKKLKIGIFLLLSFFFVLCELMALENPGRNVEKLEKSTETAILGGGCFWCLEAVFENLVGVNSVESGYSGGLVKNPTYHDVCAGTTGHAEVVKIVFDPQKITYKELLEIFFAMHDPTTLNRQGPDIGTQYRSAIYYFSDAQKKTALETMQELNLSKTWEDPIITEVQPVGEFYKAEDYHQGYFQANGNEPYCRFVISPKVQKLREKFKTKLKKP